MNSEDLIHFCFLQSQTFPYCIFKRQSEHNLNLKIINFSGKFFILRIWRLESPRTFSTVGDVVVKRRRLHQRRLNVALRRSDLRRTKPIARRERFVRRTLRDSSDQMWNSSDLFSSNFVTSGFVDSDDTNDFRSG